MRQEVCDSAKMISTELVEKVNQLKEKFPCSTDSIDRTIARNKLVGGAPRSWHLFGQAIDLIFDDTEMLRPAALYAIKLGFGGVEIDYQNNHLHLDLRNVPWYRVILADGTKQSFETFFLTDFPNPV